jgi:hypothetical protein
MSMKPRHPRSAEYTFTQWNQVPVDDPSPAVVGHTNTVRRMGSATKKAKPAHFQRRVTSLSATRATRTTPNIAQEYQGIDSNRNIEGPLLSSPVYEYVRI